MLERRRRSRFAPKCRLTWRPVAHTSSPRQRRSKSSTGPKTCARSAEFRVRRKLGVKTDVAVRRLQQENDEKEDEEREASLTEALSDKTKVAKLVVDKWFVDKGFGFGNVPTGEVVFIHASVVRGAGGRSWIPIPASSWSLCG